MYPETTAGRQTARSASTEDRNGMGTDQGERGGDPAVSSSGIVHPTGAPPPSEWWTQQGGHASAEQFKEWLNSKGRPSSEGRPAKFGQCAGHYADLGGIYLRSKLEANTLRLLMLLGYSLWTGDGEPPKEGKWVAYEWKKYRLEYKRGKEGERALWYLPDWHLWDNGTLSIWESKGLLDQRSKRLLRLMSEQVLPVVLITAEELDARRAEALYTARRQGNHIAEIPHWDEGPEERKEGARGD